MPRIFYLGPQGEHERVQSALFEARQGRDEAGSEAASASEAAAEERDALAARVRCSAPTCSRVVPRRHAAMWLALVGSVHLHPQPTPDTCALSRENNMT